MPRFVIQQHNQKDNVHFDLMLEFSNTLKTWRIPQPPDKLPQTLEQIQDHRKTYLDYEGEISGKRGFVTIWDKGEYQILLWSGSFIDIEVFGIKLHSHYHLRLIQSPYWVLEKANPE